MTKKSSPSPFQFISKRLFDLILAGVLVIIFCPIMILLYLIIRIKLGAPVFFTQERPGQNEKIFLLYKFRTMTNRKDSSGKLLSDKERLIPLGRFLRNNSLDELPQLFNVLKGDMSFVGPRPLLIKYLPHYFPRERKRFLVKPGITGWAQVNGRNLSSWSQRLEDDIWYVNNYSLRLDCNILIRTVFAVITRKGLIEDPRSVMRDLDEERRQ